MARMMWLGLLASFLLAGCGGGGGGPSDPVAAGWSRFESQDYEGARVLFLEAVTADQADAEALDGLGWSLVRLDSLEAALAWLASCVALAPVSPIAEEAQASRAAAALETEPPQDSLAIASADAALAQSPRFLFAHDNSVNWQDLRLIIAQASYGVADYDRALAEVDSLGGTPPDPASPNFTAELLAELERLWGLLH